MISPRGFAHAFSAFWADLLPMSDALIRSINVNSERYSHDHSLSTGVEPKRRALVNETAYHLARLYFTQDFELPAEPAYLDSDIFTDSFKLASEYVRRFENAGPTEELNADETNEALCLAQGILDYFPSIDRDQILFYPKVTGSGFINEGYADLLAGSLLCEFKAGDRNFRSIDLRQLLVYAALLEEKQPGKIDSIALVNPRRGVFYRAPTDDVCQTAGGISSHECYTRIITFSTGSFNSV